MAAFPTPYPEVNRVLDGLLAQAQAILGDRFTGLYLHGSLAYGGFNPRTSDIDFLVITEGTIPAKTFTTLKEMHSHLFASGPAWSQKLEGAYIPRSQVHHHDPSHPPVPWLGVDGHFALERLGSDWIIQRWILREKGIVVAGSPLRPMIDPVSPENLREAVRGNLLEWWSPLFRSPERFQSSEYRAYAVLTMCRSLYVLEQGAINSKPGAAKWAMETLGEPWVELIKAASHWEAGTRFDRLEDVFTFIRFTLAKWDLPERGL